MEKKKNVLLILSDQQRHDTLRYAGYPHMQTPCLDALAADGVLYTHAYSSNPVCMPARHDLLTGGTGRCHGYFANSGQPVRDEAVPMLPRMFAQAGYRTAAVGKMHFVPAREHHGFGEMFLMEELPRHRQDDQYATYLAEEGLAGIQNLHGVRPHIYHIPQIAQQDEAHHGTTWVADTAIDWLSANEDAPFFLMCGFIHPHPPWNIPENLVGMYDDADIPPPTPRSRSAHDDNEENEWFGDTDDQQAIRKVQEAYCTAVSMVDKNVGRIVAHLREMGLYEDTLIVFTSDHGEMLYDKGYFSKEVPYDSAARIPMIVRYPSGQTGIDPRLVSLVDLFPTVLEAAGLPAPVDDIPRFGQSLYGEAMRDILCCSTGLGQRRWIMARDARWKYVWHYNGGVEELFDLRNDPHETTDLCRTPGMVPDAPALEKLRAAALAYERAYGPLEGAETRQLCPLPMAPFHASVRGKYHFWQNTQMQAFYTDRNRQHVLLAEMRAALADRTHTGGIGLENALHDPEWVAHFMRHWSAYGEQAVRTEEVFGEKDAAK